MKLPPAQRARDVKSKVIDTIDLGRVVVRPTSRGERGRWRELMERFHYLGYRPIVGESLLYVAEVDSEWVGLLGWGSAALKLRHRDAYVGWDEETKLKRLQFVANNVRFLILPWVRVQNLASRILSLNVRRLSPDWEFRHGHSILLVETFVDQSRFTGTCYRAANWQYLGETRGASKRGRRYWNHGRPKGVFVYPVDPRACELLSGPFPPPREGDSGGSRTMTLNVNALPLEGQGGLLDVLNELSDPRKPRGKRHSFRSVLGISVCAVLSGMRSFKAIAQWAGELPRGTLRRFGCFRAKAPSEPTIRRVLQASDVEEVDERVGQWVAIQKGVTGNAICLDGKTVRGSRDGDQKACHLLSAVVQEQGVVVAQKRVDKKTNETKVVEPLLENLDIEDRVVTADALHTQRAEAEYLVEQKKADYMFTVKDNQPTLRRHLESQDWESFFPSGVHDGQGTRSGDDPSVVGDGCS